MKTIAKLILIGALIAIPAAIGGTFILRQSQPELRNAVMWTFAIAVGMSYGAGLAVARR